MSTVVPQSDLKPMTIKSSEAIKEDAKFTAAKSRAEDALATWKWKFRMFGILSFVVLLALDSYMYATSRIITTVKNTEECCSKVCSDDKYLILATLTPKTYRELFRMDAGRPECGSTCQNTNDLALDEDGYDCGFYASLPSLCGYFDDADFNATEMCCACGGGQIDDDAPAYCSLDPFYQPVIGLVSTSDCYTPMQKTEHAILASPMLYAEEIQLLYNNESMDGYTVQDLLSLFITECVVYGEYPINLNLDSMKVWDVLSLSYIVQEESAIETLVEDAMGDDRIKSEFFFSYLEDFLSLLTNEYERIREDKQAIQRIASSFSPSKASGSADIVAAWHGVQGEMETYRQNLLDKQENILPYFTSCQIELGPNISDSFPDNFGDMDCSPHFADLGVILSQLAGETFSKYTPEEVECEVACTQLGSKQCEVMEHPSHEKIFFRFLAFAGAMTFLLTFFDVIVLSCIIKYAHGVKQIPQEDWVLSKETSLGEVMGCCCP